MLGCDLLYSSNSQAVPQGAPKAKASKQAWPIGGNDQAPLHPLHSVSSEGGADGGEGGRQEQGFVLLENALGNSFSVMLGSHHPGDISYDHLG